MARSESCGLMCSWWRMLALLCLLTFLCFSHSSSVLQPVLLKTELVEKGFTLWEGKKNSEWMYPWKVTAIYSAVQRASQAKSPSVSLVQRTPQKHSFFRKTLFSSQRKFWDTVTAISAPAFSSLRRRTLQGHFTLPPLVNYVYPHFPDTDQCLLPHSPSPSSMEIQHTCYHLSVVLKIFRRLTLGVRKILHLRFLDLQGGIWTV